MGCKMKPGKKGAVAGAALAVLCLGSAAAFADITYIVDQTVTDGSKTGTVVGIITTDGALGTLLPSDFKSWNLELTGVGASLDLNNSNSTVYGAGSDVFATAREITYDYSAGDMGYLVFQEPAGIGHGLFYWCNAAPAGNTCLAGISVVPQFVMDASAVIGAQTGTLAIATAPEPSTWILTLLGFGALGLAAVCKAGKARPTR